MSVEREWKGREESLLGRGRVRAWHLAKIQSLPIIGREWEYRFYVDVTFDDPMRYRQAIDAARPLTSDFRILGEYAECPNPAI